MGGVRVHKATGFHSGVTGCKTAMLALFARRSDWLGNGNMLTHGKHRDSVSEVNFPAKLHVNIWQIQLMRMDSYRVCKHHHPPQKKNKKKKHGGSTWLFKLYGRDVQLGSYG